jgi:hypothetical protein
MIRYRPAGAECIIPLGRGVAEGRGGTHSPLYRGVAEGRGVKS